MEARGVATHGDQSDGTNRWTTGVPKPGRVPAAALLDGVGEYVDIVRYQGMTADGEPATTVHFRRYVLMLIVVSAAVWTAARLLGPGFAGAT